MEKVSSALLIIFAILSLGIIYYGSYTIITDYNSKSKQQQKSAKTLVSQNNNSEKKKPLSDEDKEFTNNLEAFYQDISPADKGEKIDATKFNLIDTTKMPTNTTELLTDNCKDFKVNLVSCTPYKCIEKVFHSRIKREIFGEKNGVCLYSELHYEKHLECRLDSIKRAEMSSLYQKNKLTISEISTGLPKEQQNIVKYEDLDVSENCYAR